MRSLITAALIVISSLVSFASQPSVSLVRSYVSIATVGRSVAILTSDSRLTVGRLDSNNELVDIRSYESVAVIGSNSDGILILDNSQRLWMIRENLTISDVTTWTMGYQIISISNSDDESIIVCTSNGVIYEYTTQGRWQPIETTSPMSRMKKVGTILVGLGGDSVLLRRQNSSFTTILRNVESYDDDEDGVSVTVRSGRRTYLLSYYFDTGKIDSVRVNHRQSYVARVRDHVILWSRGSAQVYRKHGVLEDTIYLQRKGPITDSIIMNDAEAIDSTTAIFVGESSGIVTVNSNELSMRVHSFLASGIGLFGSIKRSADGSFFVGANFETILSSTTNGITWLPRGKSIDTLVVRSIVNIWPDESGASGYAANSQGQLYRYNDYGDMLTDVGLSGSYFEFTPSNVLVLNAQRVRLHDNSMAQLYDTVIQGNQLRITSGTAISPDDIIVCGNINNRTVAYRLQPRNHSIDSVDLPSDVTSRGIRYGDELIVCTRSNDSNGQMSTDIYAVDRELRVRTLTSNIYGLPTSGLAIYGTTLFFGHVDGILRIDLTNGEILDTILVFTNDYFNPTSILPVGDSLLYVTGYNAYDNHDVRVIQLRPMVTGIRPDEIATVPMLHVGSPYPMPTSSTLSIPTEWNMVTSYPATIGVYDVTGQPVMETLYVPAPSTHSHTITMDVSGLPSGIYYVRIERQGQSFTRVMCRY